MKGKVSISFVLVIILAVVGSLLGQEKSKSPTQSPDTVTIKAEDAKSIRDALKTTEVTQLKVRALTAEIQLATKQLEDLRTQVSKEQADLQQQITTLANKNGILNISDYDISDKEGGGLVFTKKQVAKKE